LVEPLPPPAKPRTASRRTAKRILVVDDESDVARLIERLLQRAGYRVYLAEDGQEAIRRATEVHPDLITMDILMPGMSGFEVIQRLRDSPKTADIPVVVISVVKDEEEAQRLAVADYMDKPIDDEKLLKIVEHVLSRGRKILVHDSDSENRQLLEDVLSQKGYVLIFANDGLDLLLQARKEQPELILMDLQLSDMDGYEVLRRLNRRPETVDIPVVVMTDNPHETLGKVIAVGANDLVRKPIDMEALLVEIERRLEDVRERK